MEAANPGGYDLRPLTVGEVIERAARLYRTNVVAIWRVVVPLIVLTEGIYALINRSTVPAGSYVVNGQLYVPFGSNVGGYNGAVLVEGLFIPLVVVPLLSALILRVFSQAYLGARTDPQAALGFGLRRLPGMVWIGLLYAVVVVVGFVLLVIPGIYLATALSLAFAAYVVEGKSGSAALRRSRELVRGHWGSTFGALLPYSITAGLLSALLPALLKSLEHGASLSVTTYIVLLRLVNGLIWVLVAPLGAAVATTIYFDLRVRKEGFDARALGEHLGITGADDTGPGPGGAAPGGENPFALGGY
jgi:hypothetical protein